MTGRRTSSETGFLSEKGLCARSIWPSVLPQEYTVLDGEILAPTGFRDVAGIMNVAPEDAEKRVAEIGKPRYVVFDVLYYQGEDVRRRPLLERRELINVLIPVLQEPQISIVRGVSRDKQKFYDEIVSAGGEGVVLKDVSENYGDGWIKVKKFATLDVVVTGFTEARHGRTGKYVGLIGAVKVSVYRACGELVEVAQVSGMTDELRHQMSASRDSWIGRVIEIEAQEFARDRLRHPRFSRERPDADPRSATFAKMLRDLKQERTTQKQTELF